MMRQAETTVSSPETELHHLLLRLVDRLPADVVARARRSLATGELTETAVSIVAAVAAAGVPITTAGAGVLGRVLAAHPMASSLAAVERSDEDIMPVHQFSPAGPADLPDGSPPLVQTLDLTSDRRAVISPDEVDRAAGTLVSVESGAVGLWRTWRYDVTGETAPTRVYLVELAQESDVEGRRLPTFAGELQSALAECDDVPPLVEVYARDDIIPAYHQFARMWSALVWADTPAEEIRLARVFDRATPETGPTFDADHPVITDPADRQRVLDHLDAGQVLMATTSMADDVVPPRRRGVVPMTFRTDGRWIWTDATSYYLREHGIAPDPGLLEHVRTARHAPTVMDSVAIHRTLAYLQAPVEDIVWTLGDRPQ